MLRILQTSQQQELLRIMRDIQVDPAGIKIMLPKALVYLIRLDSVSGIAANILKQEMLSLGGDVAVARGVLTSQKKKTDCLMMGNLSQFIRLSQKLKQQPFGLDSLALEITQTIRNYQKSKFNFRLGRYKLNLGSRPYIMGIVNLTPDSFSGDGLYQVSGIRYQVSGIIETVEEMVKEGADIIDVGGESSRPGARPVSLKEELRRTIPVIKALAKRIKIPLSVDTYKPEVARQALDNGAVMVNDISGLRNPAMRKLVARYNVGVIIMHMQGRPRTMQNNPVYNNSREEIISYLAGAMQKAIAAGISRERLIIDPGIGFGKTMQHNLEILRNLGEFKVLGRPILVGPSRKSFIGKILNARPQERVFGTVASCVLAIQNGAHLFRVHDVKAVSEALRVTQNIIRYN